MKPIEDMPQAVRERIRYLFTDIDDTLTTSGRLPAEAYSAMEALWRRGVQVVPITGRPAGWCDHMARMWPIEGIVGENGAFYFRYDTEKRKMVRRYWKSEAEREADRIRLDQIRKRVLKTVPGCRVSADQAFRVADLAIDFREDVAPLDREAVARIVACFTDAGAKAKVSSIHVNGWFGDYDKLAMARVFSEETWGVPLDAAKDMALFIGDSPNDAPMFAAFPQSVGVANVLEMRDLIPFLPAWITGAKGGAGFAEMAAILLERNPQVSAPAF